MLPTISNTFTISTSSDEPIRVLEREQGEPTRVGVDLYCNQSVSQDDDSPFQSYSTMFFGRNAKNVAQHFSPGDKIRIDGHLYVDTNGQYTDLEIRQSSWQFPAQDNGGANGRSAGNQTRTAGSQAGEAPDPKRNRSTPNPSQPSGGAASAPDPSKPASPPAGASGGPPRPGQ